MPPKQENYSANFWHICDTKAFISVKLARELKVGIISILAIVGLYWGINYLKGTDIFSDKRLYYAVYERIDGLDASRPIMVNGYKVGQVDNIYFHPDGSTRLIVEMNIYNEMPIPANTVARIYSSDLLGDKAIELLLGDANTYKHPGDTLISNIQLSLTEEVNEQVKPIKDKAEKLIGSIDTVMILAQGFLNDDNKQTFTQTFESIRRSFTTLENSIQVFDRTLSNSQDDLESSFKNLAEVTSALEGNRDEMDKIFSNLSSVSDSLAQVRFKETFASLNKALESTEAVMRKVNQGEGSAGLLVNDPEVYRNLAQATEQLNLLLLDVKYNPRRYLNFSVFGKTKQYSEKELLELEAEAKAEREKAAADTISQK